MVVKLKMWWQKLIVISCEYTGHWVTDQGLDVLTPLSTSTADRLLEDLGIAEYMETVMCDRSTSPYSPSVSQKVRKPHHF
jgi:hypothetical protein